MIDLHRLYRYLLTGPVRARSALLLAVVGPPAIAWLLVAVRSSFASPAAALVLVGFVVGLAVFGTRLSGIVGTIISSLSFDFFLTQPYYTFSITHRNDIETAVTLFAVGVAITEIATRGKQDRRRVRTSSQNTRLLHDIGELLAQGVTPQIVAGRLAVDLIDVLGLRDCHFQSGISDHRPAILGADGEVRWAGAIWEVDRTGFPGRELEIPVQFGRRIFGRFTCIPTPGQPVSLEARLVATALAAQLATALATTAKAG